MRAAASLRRLYRPLLAAGFGIVAAALSLFAGGTIPQLDGLLYDLSLAKLAAFDDAPPEREPVVIVALDRDSLDAPGLQDSPRALMSPVWARLLDGLFAAGARVVVFDLIFAYNANRLVPDYDRPFLDALGRHRERVVLARSARTPIADSFFYAVRGDVDPDAVGLAEIGPDPDGVHRRVQTSFATVDGDEMPALSGATLARVGYVKVPDVVLLSARRHLEAMPTYSLIDVLACADGDPARLADAVRDRIVFVGTTLPEEDRKLTPSRFLPPPRAAAAAAGSCGPHRMGASEPTGKTVPGVFVHAAAVEAVETRRVTDVAPPLLSAATASATGIVGTLFGFAFAPWVAVAAVLVAALGLFVAGTALFSIDLWLPLALPMAVMGGGTIVAYLMRFLLEERRRRRVQHAFSHYLAPSVVDRLMEDESGLRLGGETREVTVMFADLSGFTALSGKLPPDKLMETTNRYLGVIVEAVEATGGYVDKFIGDAVMAIWGAPVHDPEHALSGTRAAVDAVARVAAEAQRDQARGLPSFAVKIGLNSGAATIGNVGAEKRYNYTAVGETVNIAARLEGLPGDYGCRIVVGPATAAAIGRAFLLNELDWIKVKGKAEPIAVHQVIGPQAAMTEADRAYVADYGDALARYRAGDFAAAAAAWRAIPPGPDWLGPTRGPPPVMAGRAEDLMAEPPAGQWDGVWVKTTK